MPVTREQVEEARRTYEELREQFHGENTSVVRLERRPDGYRGDLSCIRILDEVEREMVKNGGAPNIEIVRKNGVIIGELSTWYGNHGKGKLASQTFTPAKGVDIEWQQTN